MVKRAVVRTRPVWKRLDAVGAKLGDPEADRTGSDSEAQRGVAFRKRSRRQSGAGHSGDEQRCVRSRLFGAARVSKAGRMDGVESRRPKESSAVSLSRDSIM